MKLILNGEVINVNFPTFLGKAWCDKQAVQDVNLYLHDFEVRGMKVHSWSSAICGYFGILITRLLEMNVMEQREEAMAAMPWAEIAGNTLTKAPNKRFGFIF